MKREQRDIVKTSAIAIPILKQESIINTFILCINT